ncbi:Aste57867_17911 [Aphanomyces stellatus]|uniref:Aste57867_17911 protein n=1 Tax=Aphanomyces stellatus TaxID=120398 RepID=A0A485L8Q6_9STRA|nr:hypothetical protein As57867_017850 [Aphanomyces stellatus]VFT94653.1 Aste57867_17911 [Aphanomyces stellatus]
MARIRIQPQALGNAPSETRRLLLVAGIVYVVVAAFVSLYYLVLVAPSVANDFWWPRFTTAGVQTFLGDLYNAKTMIHVRGSLDLFAPSSVVVRDYAATGVFIATRPVAARAILLDHIPLQDAIRLIRSISLIENMQTISSPCWLDFNRTYELAHTGAHQVLCNTDRRRTTNAAVYIETYIRNTRTNDFVTSVYYPAIQSCLLDGVVDVDWVAAIERHKWPSIADEVAYWHTFGITTFQNTLQNYFEEGFVDALSIVNALGLPQHITIGRRTGITRPQSRWTTMFASLGFWNDLDACAQTNSSMVRSAPNLFEINVMSWDMWDFGPAGTPATALIRGQLSPLATIDIHLVVVPPSLQRLVQAFQTALFSALGTSTATLYLALDEPTVVATPASWIHPNALYYGGNPMCPYGSPMPFVQPSFGYYDDCGLQIPHAIQLTRDATLFAFLVRPTTDIHILCTLASPASTCIEQLEAVYSVLDSLGSLRPHIADLATRVTADLVPLNISFLQWATIDDIDQILHQPMVRPESESDPWSFLGWMTLYDWANGHREVFTFEGDYDTVTLMSQSHALDSLAAIAAELPATACRYLWALCLYLSILLSLLLVLVLIYAAFHGVSNGLDLLHSTRILGSTWLGRPLLVARGLTAVLLLATSPVEFVDSGLARLVLAPPSWYEKGVLAGEVVWLTFVVSDIWSPLTSSTTFYYAPLASVGTWVAVLALEPYRMTATIDKQCAIVTLTVGVKCTSGVVYIGSVDRTLLLLGIVLTSSLASYVLVRCVCHRPVRSHTGVHVTLPSIAQVFLSHSNRVDVVSCLLSGLIPMRSCFFDVKLWVVVRASSVASTRSTMAVKVLQASRPDHGSVPRAESPSPSCETRKVVSAEQFGQPQPPSFAGVGHLQSWGLVGLFVMATSVVSSFLFLSYSQEMLANDFLWTGFDATFTHSFLCTFLNQNLQMANPMQTHTFNDMALGVYYVANASTTSIGSSSLYVNAVQDEANTLDQVIHGLRQPHDACLHPWIATAYCYVDFERTWSMAYSPRRQVRCLGYAANGAVYLESLLRNVDSPTWVSCWGHAMESAVFSSLRVTHTGVEWIQRTESSDLTVHLEATYWRQHGIQTFSTQWQNFKLRGIYESFDVTNALGVSYALALKQYNRSFQLAEATSFKMYWSLASVLNQVVANDTVLSGTSLVGTSPAFAFQNATTMETALAQHYTLVLPLDGAYSAFTATVGPFGTVDLWRVPCPQSLLALYRTMSRFLMTTMGANDTIEAAFTGLYQVIQTSPQPSAWDNVTLWGGDLNCGLNYGGWCYLPLQFFGTSGLCANYNTDYSIVSSQNIILALLASGLFREDTTVWTATTQRDMLHHMGLWHVINVTSNFIMTTMTTDQQRQFDSAVQTVKSLIRDSIRLELVHYVGTVDGTDITLSHVNLFSDADFELFAWLYLFEWVEGKREVVTFQGDISAITTLSTTQLLDVRSINAQEIPRNVSAYLLRVVQYITLVLFGVGCLACLYILQSRGYVEGLHMLSFNFVAGHVWVGRPLMLLRGLTALCMLSTSNLHLTRAGSLAYFTSAAPHWFFTCVSAGETSWLVYVVVDTFSVFTGAYTASYSVTSVYTVSLLAAIWTLLVPITHSLSIDRQCTVTSVDLDVVCTSGQVAIGDSTRFYSLVGLAILGTLVSYIVERCRRHHTISTSPHLSFLLYSAAKYEFEQNICRRWTHDGTFYMDKATAVVTGIVAVEMTNRTILLDIKTWRVFSIPAQEMVNLPPHLRRALPLFD